MSKSMRVLIADDERPARDKLREFIEAECINCVIHEAADGTQALNVIRAESPDIIFMDIRMPGATGVEIAEHLPEDLAARVIFVTAYDEYAVQAFDLRAMDYLLKPFNRERFNRAWERAHMAPDADRHEQQSNHLRAALMLVGQDLSERLQRVLVDDDDRKVLVDLSSIARVEAARNYLTIVSGDKQYRLRRTISDFESRVDPAVLVRVNRSTMVNASRIRELQSVGHGDYDIKMNDGVVVRLSRRYRDRLEAWT